MQPAPPREGRRLSEHARFPEADDRKHRNRFGGLGGSLKPRAARPKAGDVDRPPRRIETPDQLDHLAFGAAWLEGAEHDSNRQRDRHGLFVARVVPARPFGAVASHEDRAMSFAKTALFEKGRAVPGRRATYRRCQRSNTTSSHSRSEWSRRPDRCSSTSRRTNACWK